MYKETFKMVDGDMVVTDKGFELETGEDELRQSLENRFSINKGEWFLDLELGLDYSEIWGKGKLDSQIELAIRECGLSDDRVSRIEVINIERDNYTRESKIPFKIVGKDERVYRQEVVGIE